MTGRIAITLAAFVAGLAIASLPSTSSATICKEIVSLGIDRCECPIDEIQHLDVRPFLEDIEFLATHRISDFRNLIGELAE